MRRIEVGQRDKGTVIKAVREMEVVVIDGEVYRE